MSLYERRSEGRSNDPTEVRRKLHGQFRRTFAAGTTLTMNTLWRASPRGIVANVIGGICLIRNEGETLVCAVTVGNAERPKSPTQYLLYTKLGDGAMKRQSGIAASTFEAPSDSNCIGRDLRGISLLRVMKVSPLATRRATLEYSALLRSSGELADPSIEALIHEDPSLKAIEEYGAKLRDHRDLAAGDIPPPPPDVQ